jgi:hypothetical protein
VGSIFIRDRRGLDMREPMAAAEPPRAVPALAASEQ